MGKDSNAILNKVAKFISKNQLLENGGHYIVALSGGADSIALTLMLKSLNLNISAAHCNFHLRGEESERDEQFCVNFCQHMDIPLHRIHFDTQSYAELHKVSIEMAARDLRYRYFEQLRKDIEADGICVAHHQDDNVETLLLNLLRGSGVDGLAAIAPKNGNILRPLLCISRNEILAYLQENNQEFVTDSTNLEDDALRNKIRHHVIPLLESINPAAKENIAHSATYIRQAKIMLESWLASPTDSTSTNSTSICKQEIHQAASPEFMLHHQLGKFGFHGEVIDQILEAMDALEGTESETNGIGKIWKNSQFMVAIDRKELIVTPLKTLESIQNEKEFRFPEEGNYSLGMTEERTDQQGERKVKIKRYPRTPDFEPSKDSLHITLDADKVAFPLTYRLTKEGDRFCPFGMEGSKLVSDYLTDRKRNYLQKASQHVMTDRQGNIIWLVGERTSDKCRIDDATQNILKIEISD